MIEKSNDLSIDLIIQYTIVGVILLAAFGWILWKMVNKRKNKVSGSCCGCAIADSCKKVQKKGYGRNQNLQ